MDYQEIKVSCLMVLAVLMSATIGIFSKLFKKKPQPKPEPRGHPNKMFECGPGKQHHVLHGEVVGGLGLMGDTAICLRCGLEKYHESWPLWVDIKKGWDTKTYWPLIDIARKLPGGIHDEYPG